MQVIEEKVKMYQAKDGTKFKDRGECEVYEKSIPYGNYYAKLSELKEFEVTENHLKLIKRKIRNYYGGLFVMENEGKYYWLIENQGTDFNSLSSWSEIDKELYDSLLAHDVRHNQIAS